MRIAATSVLAALALLTGLAGAVLPVGLPSASADPQPGAPASSAPPFPLSGPVARPSHSPSPAPSTTPSPSPSATGPSASTAPRTSTAAPGAVRALAWQALRGGARLTWKAPAGAPAGTEYTVVLHAEGSSERTTGTADTHLVVSPVRAGTALTATVAATVGGVAGPATAAPPWVEPAATPDAPPIAALTVVTDPPALRVTWAPPATTDGQALTGFVVELRTVTDPATAAARRTVASSVRTVDFRGLPSGTRYFATVAAVNAAGAGAQRETATAVLQGTGAAACAACAAPAVQQPAATRRAAPAASTGSPAPQRTAAAGSPVPVSSGMPLHLALGIGGIVIAACLAVTAVLLRRRSALG